MNERDLTHRQITLKKRNTELLEKLQDPEAEVSTTSHVISGLMGIGHPVLNRDILGPGRFVLRKDPSDPKRRVITGEEFKELKNIVAEIKGIK